jgi:spore maturation protein CgeB
MKILFSGAFNPAFEALPEYLARALTRLGHEVTLFDHRAFVLPGRLRAGWTALDRWDRRRLNAAFATRARAIDARLILVNQGMTIEAATIEALRAEGRRTVNWVSDHPAEFERGLEIAASYDAFHVASSWAAGQHRERGRLNASWLPFGCDDEQHRPLDPGEPPLLTSLGRVVLVGTHYPERQILLRHLAGLPVDVYGPGWERAAGDPQVAPMIRGGSLPPSFWRRLYGSAAAVLNIHYGAFGPDAASGNLASTRVFEILGCGALQIANRQGDLVRLFHDDEEFLGFSSGDELRAQVERALADPVSARRIASAGRAAVLEGHTYLDRARLLVEGGRFALPARPDAGDAARGDRWRVAAGGGR